MKYITSVFLFISCLSISLQAQDNTSAYQKLPIFQGCDQIEDISDRQSCSEKKMNEYISENLVFPETAKSKKTKGVVVAQFVVNKQGKIEQPSIINDLKNDTGNAVLQLLEKMNREITWQPASHRGKAVNVIFNLPVRFDLGEIELVGQEVGLDYVRSKKYKKYFEGTVFINGKIRSLQALNKYHRDEVISLFIYKGDAARKKYKVNHRFDIIVLEVEEEEDGD
jgi:hypothetical protein